MTLDLTRGSFAFRLRKLKDLSIKKIGLLLKLKEGERVGNPERDPVEAYRDGPDRLVLNLTPPDQPSEIALTIEPTSATIANLPYGETGALTEKFGSRLLVANDADIASIPVEVRHD